MSEDLNQKERVERFKEIDQEVGSKDVIEVYGERSGFSFAYTNQGRCYF